MVFSVFANNKVVVYQLLGDILRRRPGPRFALRATRGAATHDRKAKRVRRSLSEAKAKTDWRSHASPSHHVVAEQIIRTVGGHDVLADQVAQGFRRAAAERAVARAAIEAVDGIFLGEAEAAMHLQRVIGHAQGHLVAEHLGDRGHEGIWKRIGGCAGTIKDAASGLDVLVHVGELPAVALEIADRLAKHLAI